ncbi:hypothetical protein HY947_05595 [Candidatus Gottesmanbacteria bacterium]|nr:hypothetical protein [Candidatus Gottesmanbacteria bacterium]
MAGLPRQIIGSFEDIGKDIVREVSSVPKDVVGKALETLGTSSGSKKTQQTSIPAGEKKSDPNSPLESLDKAGTSKEKKIIARSALEYLASAQKQQSKEKSVWEKQQDEDQRRKEQIDLQQHAARTQTLQPMSSKKKRGDLYGAQAKKTAVENKNTRQD